MKILSVNLGVPTASTAKPIGRTGIRKRPADGPVELTVGGVAGDFIADGSRHGGPGQAVYCLGEDDYRFWRAETGLELLPGSMGENLTLDAVDHEDLCIGDRLVAGEAVLEVSGPRVPCTTLAERMGDPAFLKRFRDARRPGFYARVISEGPVRAGDTVYLVKAEGANLPLLDFFDAFFDKPRDAAVCDRLLAAPLAERYRAAVEKWWARGVE